MAGSSYINGRNDEPCYRGRNGPGNEGIYADEKVGYGENPASHGKWGIKIPGIPWLAGFDYKQLKIRGTDMRSLYIRDCCF